MLSQMELTVTIYMVIIVGIFLSGSMLNVARVIYFMLLVHIYIYGTC